MDKNFEKQQLIQEKLNVKVEVATEEDVEAYRSIRLEALSGEDGKMFGATPEMIQEEKEHKDWIKDLSSPDKFIVLAWEGSKVVGMGRAEKEDSNEKGVWRLGSGYVTKDSRGKGIQLKLIAKRLRAIKEKDKNATKAIINVRASNKTSLKNTKSFGFNVIDSEWVDDHNDTDEPYVFYLMELDNLDSEKLLNKINEVLDAG